MAQRDPWEVYSAAPSSIAGPAKVPDAPKPYEAATDQAQLTGIELDNQRKAQELAKPDAKPAIDPKINAALQTDDALSAIARARKLISGWSTGAGGQLLQNFGGTDSRDLATTLSTVKSGITLGKLAELKALSEKGASGLGALSDNEAKLLSDSVAGIDQFQSPDGLLTSLDAIEKHYRNVLALTNGDDPRTPEAQQKYGIVSQTPDGAAAAIGATPPSAGGSTQVGAATELTQGDTALEDDPALAGLNAEVAKRVSSGQSTQEITNYIKSAGVTPDEGTVGRIDGWTQFIKANPSYRGAVSVSLEKRSVPLSATRQILNEAAQSPLGTAIASGADALTAFQLPNLTGNAPLARAGLNALGARNPIASTVGTIAGGVAAGAGLEAGIGRAGVQGAAGALAPRLLASDAIYGGAAANGLDPDSGISGALGGAALGLGGGLGARAALRGLGGVVSPSGGDLPISYAGGARPTIGQRFGREGALGASANNAEQALMSVPVLGSSVRGARQGARDAWETTGIRNALREIDSDLPQGVERGPDAMAFMRQEFSQAYDQARSGMQFVPDADFKRDLGGYTRRVVNSGILDGETRGQLQSILENTVSSRLRNGGLSGDAYKIAYSDLGDAITASSRKPELQSALKEYRDLFESAARRNSNPEAVAVMDAADRGYSQYRPMRDASAMAGSEPGRFTPTSLASVERRTKGKTAAYVEGNTRLGDYVNEGMALRDTLPDSGTAGRALTFGAGTGAALNYAPTPLTAVAGAALGGLSAATLPGVRRVVGAALAPRSSAKLRTLGDLIRERQTALGYAGAPLALEYQEQ